MPADICFRDHVGDPLPIRVGCFEGIVFHGEVQNCSDHQGRQKQAEEKEVKQEPSFHLRSPDLNGRGVFTFKAPKQFLRHL